MMDRAGQLATGWAAFGRRDWPRARACFRQVAARGELDAEGLFALADCAWWLGDIDEALAAYEESYRRHLEEDLPARAAMAALLLGAHAMERGDSAVGSGWMSRARRLLRDVPEGPEHGYPLYWDVFAAMAAGDLDGALSLGRRIQDLGQRFEDPNLVAIGLMAEGRALIKQGEVTRGQEALDESMLAVVSDRLHPLWTGGIYCHLMDVCHELVDLRRAEQWTEATARWCDSVAEAVLYRGICRVHRAQVFQWKGAWERAEQEATRAGVDLAGVHVGTVAEAHYETGEIRRLRGDVPGAEDSFGRAHDLGRDPQPGLALLRVAQGKTEVAHASLHAAMAAKIGDTLGRVPLCAALVEVALTSGEVETARAASAELRATAQSYPSDGLHALAQKAQGAVLLADGAPLEALPPLREACRVWHELDAPYEVARARVLLARAYRVLQDEDAAIRELDAAETSFAQLGATPDVRHIDELRGRRRLPGSLSEREVEVLRLVATGKTNREIAAALHISDKTVARHLANVYLKIDVPSRTAAAAYAFEQGLVGT